MIASSYPVYKVFLPEYCALDRSHAARVIVENAIKRESFGVTALAVHGLMESYNNPELGNKINKINMIVPDGQPVVWALNLVYGLKLKFKVPGPDLTSEVLRNANESALKIFLFGSTSDTLERFKKYINENYKNLQVVGMHEDRFREASHLEDLSDIKKINDSGAHIVLVGRGCPRQEHWVADHIGTVNSVMLAVGAAFDYHAGNLERAPMWAQQYGLEWCFRLAQEPRRLWKRYLVSNSQFVYQLVKELLSSSSQR